MLNSQILHIQIMYEVYTHGYYRTSCCINDEPTAKVMGNGRFSPLDLRNLLTDFQTLDIKALI